MTELISRLDKTVSEDDEIFLTSCDLTEKPTAPLAQVKGCIIKNSTIPEDNEENVSLYSKNYSVWKKYLCCKPCIKSLNDGIWMLSVRCARVAPDKCKSNKCCSFLDMVGMMIGIFFVMITVLVRTLHYTPYFVLHSIFF